MIHDARRSIRSFAFFVFAICMASEGLAWRKTTLDHSPYDVADHVSSADEIARMSGYGEEKLSTVLITGTLLCNSCSFDPDLQPLPISGALVAATCDSKDLLHVTRNKKPTWEKGVTDDNGEFIIDLPSQLHAVPDLHKACSIKILYLPKDSPCQSASSKAKERLNKVGLSSVGNGIRTYTTGTIQFLQRNSENPETCKKTTMEVIQDMAW